MESGRYPEWEYKAESEFRDKAVGLYEEMFNEKAQVCVIHAGLECGLFAEKKSDLDMISMGPDMMNVHTPKERLSVKSVAKIWDYLLDY